MSAAIYGSFDRIILYSGRSADPMLRALNTPLLVSGIGHHGYVPKSALSKQCRLVGRAIRRYAIWSYDRALIELWDLTVCPGPASQLLPPELCRQSLSVHTQTSSTSLPTISPNS